MNEYDKDMLTYMNVFFPGYLERNAQKLSDGQRLVYYTSAETAQKIIQDQHLWLRNASLMNDFSEISYGLEFVAETLLRDSGQEFRDAVSELNPEVLELTLDNLRGWEQDWRLETYISCVSEHDFSEDQSGRLSMWRAYGDVALVLNSTPFGAVTDKLKVYSTEVNYWDGTHLKAHLDDIILKIDENSDYLSELSTNQFVGFLHEKFKIMALATKHPGFKEEREWRIYFRPSELGEDDCILSKKIVVLDGVPQTIWSLPLRHDPDNGLFHADLPSLLDRLIIGPTEYPYVSAEAFRELLVRAGVDASDPKVTVSDIPLRSK
ncbi:DUF2971 domain-containing protein [Yoonia sp. SS1-5]|uniref:DUF2971 domain-containing protein n=1 Tax=Yoonia rhodophyticola TaxID=3137370 RepID=A0AAN0MAV6_9RHOB